ncbi:MAG: succinate dehydrogenase cytochrome b subunit [Bacteroidota bacterium]
MSWINKLFSSSIGQKFIMGLTGLFLISFLLVHCGINALIFFNDGGETFNAGAEFMATNLLIRTMEWVLFIGLILHIIKGFSLWNQNNQARPVKYAMQDGKANSKWYSRSMGLLGTLLLMFLIIHLRHFWVVSRFTDEITSGRETLFNEMKEVFEHLWIVVLYVLAMVSLSYHLMHGFQSAFQTLGLNHKKYTPAIKSIGVAFSIIIPFIFALMPIAMHFEFIK